METRFITRYEGERHTKRVKKIMEEREDDMIRRFGTIHLSENHNRLQDDEDILRKINVNMDTYKDKITRSYYKELY
jgi:hypothetical protein